MFICNKCGKDFNDDPDKNRKIFKIILAGKANMLCWVCKCYMEDEITNIAVKYLSENTEFHSTGQG